MEQFFFTFKEKWVIRFIYSRRGINLYSVHNFRFKLDFNQYFKQHDIHFFSKFRHPTWTNHKVFEKCLKNAGKIRGEIIFPTF